jgi:hypothetical protein
MNGQRYTDEELLDVVKSDERLSKDVSDIEPGDWGYRNPKRPANRPVKLAIADTPTDRDTAMEVDNKRYTARDTPNWNLQNKWAKNRGATHASNGLRTGGPADIARTAHEAQKLKSLIKSIDYLITRLDEIN